MREREKGVEKKKRKKVRETLRIKSILFLFFVADHRTLKIITNVGI